MWSSPAERSGDGALDRPLISDLKFQISEGSKSGVALRLPPHSKLETRHDNDSSTNRNSVLGSSGFYLYLRAIASTETLGSDPARCRDAGTIPEQLERKT